MPATRADLGQFFTPREVIDFALGVLSDLGARIEGASVVDPACGPGEWLARALAAGASEVIGIDRDPAMAPLWCVSGLAGDMRAHLMVADGLAPHLALGAGASVVVGNPPFGVELADTGEGALREIAQHYALPACGDQSRLFAHPSSRELERLRRFPIEVLFLERFLQICAPHGWVAIVLPEGVFSNSRWRHVREWLLRESTVHIVVGLPRATFSDHATTARTCLMILRNSSPPQSHRSVLCQVDDCSAAALRALREAVAGSGELPGHLDLTPPILSR